MNPSVEQLHHFVCAACKKWWTIGDAPKNKKEWFCPWCGKSQTQKKKKSITLSKEARQLNPGAYQHFKGDIMEVVGVALHSETLEEFVVYAHTTGAHAGEKHFWIRPLAMFAEIIERDGKKMPRFTYIKNVRK